MLRRDRVRLLRACPAAALRTIGKMANSWHQSLQRASFHNLNEYDPRVLDVEAWMDYWKALHPQVFVVSCAGLVAFYPSRLPDHPRSQFLGNRDVFGEYFRAAKKRGMRVIARIE